jgi:hypothetical protein
MWRTWEAREAAAAAAAAEVAKLNLGTEMLVLQQNSCIERA